MFQLSNESLQPIQLKEALITSSDGALAQFEGYVRNHNEGHSVNSLEYKAYPELCQKEADKIIDEAKEKYAVTHISCAHRVGHLQIGDLAVWIGVSASHRGQSFDALRYMIDELKKRLPIWKKEHYTDGSSEWIGPISNPTEVHVS